MCYDGKQLNFSKIQVLVFLNAKKRTVFYMIISGKTIVETEELHFWDTMVFMDTLWFLHFFLKFFKIVEKPMFFTM